MSGESKSVPNRMFAGLLPTYLATLSIEEDTLDKHVKDRASSLLPHLCLRPQEDKVLKRIDKKVYLTVTVSYH
jgi:hypothetical protein